MCYKCDICGTVSEPSKPRRTWALKRADGSIARELAVCGDCLWLLQLGTPYPVVQRQRPNLGRMTAIALPEPEADPEPPPLVDVEPAVAVPLPTKRVISVRPPAKIVEAMRAKRGPI